MGADFVALSAEETSLVLVKEQTRIEIIRINQIENIETPGEAASA